MNLYWDSWDRNHPKSVGLSPRITRTRATRASVPSEDYISGYNNNISKGGVIPPSNSVSSISSLNVLRPPLTPPPQGKGGKGMHDVHVYVFSIILIVHRKAILICIASKENIYF